MFLKKGGEGEMFIRREKEMCMHEQNWHHGVAKRGVIRTEEELIPIAPAGKSILNRNMNNFYSS